jgi:hypothetical protein
MTQYRAKIVKQSGSGGGSPLHLIVDGSPSSVCGVPSERLTAGGLFDEVVCAQCLEEMPRPKRLKLPGRKLGAPAR